MHPIKYLHTKMEVPLHDYKYLFFDLDGTLTESGVGIMHSAQYALEQLGFTVENTETLRPFIGPPIEDSFKSFCNMNESQAQEAVRIFRERYAEVGVYENSKYDGIDECLKCLHNSGYTLVLATSKPQDTTELILEKFGLDEYFDFVAGRDAEGRRRTKADAIRHAIEKLNIDDLYNIAMIGDRRYDIYGAKELGLDTVGVLWGYGDREELEDAGADAIMESVADLTEYFCRK